MVLPNIIVKSNKILASQSSNGSSLKAPLHDQFLCDKFSYFYVTNVFGRVDETTIIVDALDSCLKNIYEQRYLAQ